MKLSIITVNRNNPEGLRRTLESVLSQTRTTDYEQIVIDGASDRGDVEVLKELSGRFEERAIPFTYVSEPDSGIYNAMNKGIRKANGEYCLFLNSGDALYDDRVIEDVMELGLDADIVSGNIVLEKSKFQKESARYSTKEARAREYILGMLPHQATFLRSSLFHDIHFYDESFSVVSDWMFSLEMLLVYHKTYKHIHMYVARCDTEGISNVPENARMMDDENYRGLKKVLPLFYEDYEELRRIYRDQNKEDYQLFLKFRKTRFCKALLLFRHLLDSVGYFTLKQRIKRFFYFSRIKREDARKKKDVAKAICALSSGMLKRKNDATDVIVSLTSYGKRVTDAAPYAIYSLFQQTELPNRIVLYLDGTKWNDENIPLLLKRLKKSGLEIVYGEDVRSYTKLLPALKMFPENPIITVDDDLYYDKEVVSLLKAHYEDSDKKTPIALHGNIAVRRNGKYVPYSEWPDSDFGDEASDFSLYGVHGAIYPPHLFDEEVFNKDVFLKLAPYADDIWFWVQEKRLGIKTKVIRSFNSHRNISVNRIEEMDYSQKGTLFFKNVVSGRNDEQLEKLLNYYQR